MKQTRPFLLALSLAALCAGCTDPPTDADAGAPDAAVPHALTSPAPPSSPVLPTLTPCPSGWREVDVGPAVACEPFGDDATPRCGRHEVLVHGRAAGMACEPAHACPAGEWPDDAPPGAIYARAGALDGDGSRERPYGSLDLAVSAASAAGLPIVLGEGALAGGVQIRGVPSITGLCPERTRIVDPSTSMSAPLIVRPGTLTLRGVHLEGALYGLWLTTGAEVIAEGVTAEGASSAIRLDSGSTLDATHVRAESPRTNELEDPTLRLGPGSVAMLREATLIGGGSLAYGYRRASDPADAHASLTIETSTLLDAPVGVAGRLHAVLRRVAIENVGVAAVTTSPWTTTLEDVRAARVAQGVATDSAFVTGAGGTTTLARVSILGVGRGAAVLALGSISPDAAVVGRDVIVAGVGGDVALGADAGGSLDLARVVVMDAAGTAVQAASGGHLTLVDATIVGTAAGSDDTFGSAVGALGAGSTVTLERLAARPHAYGLAIVDGASATGIDVDVEGGLGLAVQCDPGAGCLEAGALLTLERARVVDAGRFGLAAFGAHASVQDLDVDGVTVARESRFPGMGMVAAFGATVTATRVRVRAVAGLGALSLADATIEASNLEVEATGLRTCPDCEGSSHGDGIACAERGTLRLSGFRVRGSARAGLAAALACAPPEFGPGVIEGNGVGILTDTSVDATLFRSLLVRDNGTDYDRTDLSLGAAEVGLSDSSL